jgi:hypothetical protein
VLYANSQISSLLRERFVLHWQSMRPVPKLTIDFGDGRKLERTLTGNSIHYVLDSDGRLIDALPGLYAPERFRRELERIASVSTALASIPDANERNTARRQYFESRFNELENEWRNDVRRAGLRSAPSREIPQATNQPSAAAALPVAVSKAAIERPVLRGMLEDPRLIESSNAGWSLIASLHANEAALDEASRKLMLFKNPSYNPGSLQLAVLALQRSIAEDSVRNEYIFRSRIYRWLAGGDTSDDVALLNEKIYSELFLTPSSDAWLGLRPPDTYSGIDNDGVRK